MLLAAVFGMTKACAQSGHLSNDPSAVVTSATGAATWVKVNGVVTVIAVEETTVATSLTVSPSTRMVSPTAIAVCAMRKVETYRESSVVLAVGVPAKPVRSPN